MASFSSTSSPMVADWTVYLDKLTKWERFAIFLPEIQQYHVDKIQKDNLGLEDSVDRSKTALWTVWTKIYPQASWSDVVEALKKTQENRLADDIEKQLVENSAPPPTSNEQRGKILTLIIINLSKTNKSTMSLLP